ncbi:T-lymphocyte surface antigen Ly-9 [Danio aesculapii]|uniref:T-lymphocyte surface antigen Ly-9 n=1 Tax=Danio aesculapii TaxID=1142201 RepID=UPI0024BFEED0|nr:T-lymphocyte surface antigen Ly-9 [Danio aesculapii]
MNVFQSSCCSILGALLLFLLHGSCAGGDVEVVHKAVGDSLDLPANHLRGNLVEWKFNEKTFAEYDKDQFKPVQPPLFPERIKTNNDHISITIEDLKHQDSGNFTIVAEKGGGSQLPTKLIVLHVHNRIKNVEITHKISRLSKNCTFHLHCETTDDLNSSYSWIIGDQGKSLGPQLNISLHPAESSRVSCTADNTVSKKSTEETLECPEESKYTSTELWLTVGISILVIVILTGIIIACFQWRKRKGQTESEAGITVYEDVKPEAPAKMQRGE